MSDNDDTIREQSLSRGKDKARTLIAMGWECIVQNLGYSVIDKSFSWEYISRLAEWHPPQPILQEDLLKYFEMKTFDLNQLKKDK
jgi:hypothetical protein